ncbi:MAG TPA: PQQ-dependent sugar dehydrogenase, partial [Tepidisphaeraceae bacterium]|nr:PQQ-dependent sugar dehydrogenase [Tepidisphaeraceae bacterium]
DVALFAQGLVKPNAIVSAFDGSGRLFVAEVAGYVRVVNSNGSVNATPFLDAYSYSAGSIPRVDAGLKGIAFHPDFAVSGAPGEGLFYAAIEERNSAGTPDFGPTTHDLQGVVYEYQIDSGNPNIVDPSSRRELMRVNIPNAVHSINAIAFDSSDQLYISMGNGNQRSTQQNLNNLWGKILRVDPLGSNSANGEYGIPASNPFVGTPGALEEIYASGFRNAWKIALDENDNLYAGDVGENTIEEVDVVVAGGNYGFPHKEGSFKLNNDNTVSTDLTGLPPGLIDPLVEYDRDDGRSVTLGGVYNGSVGQLSDALLFSDWGSGALYYVPAGDDEMYRVQRLNGTSLTVPFAASLGFDEVGEAYIASYYSGQIYRLVPEPTLLCVLAGLGLFVSSRPRRTGRC